MFRNLIFGSLLAPLGAALPLALLVIGAGALGTIASGDPLALSNGFVQSLYALFAAYFFGWPAALVIGAGNGIVWLLLMRPMKRLLLSPVIGLATALGYFAFIFILSGTATGPLQALPALFFYGALGAIGSLFSTLIVLAASRTPVKQPA